MFSIGAESTSNMSDLGRLWARLCALRDEPVQERRKMLQEERERDPKMRFEATRSMVRMLESEIEEAGRVWGKRMVGLLRRGSKKIDEERLGLMLG